MTTVSHNCITNMTTVSQTTQPIVRSEKVLPDLKTVHHTRYSSYFNQASSMLKSGWKRDDILTKLHFATSVPYDLVNADSSVQDARAFSRVNELVDRTIKNYGTDIVVMTELVMSTQTLARHNYVKKYVKRTDFYIELYKKLDEYVSTTFCPNSAQLTVEFWYYRRMTMYNIFLTVKSSKNHSVAL